MVNLAITMRLVVLVIVCIILADLLHHIVEIHIVIQANPVLLALQIVVSAHHLLEAVEVLFVQKTGLVQIGLLVHLKENKQERVQI
jgi:hypothetical protein